MRPSESGSNYATVSTLAIASFLPLQVYSNGNMPLLWLPVSILILVLLFALTYVCLAHYELLRSFSSSRLENEGILNPDKYDEDFPKSAIHLTRSPTTDNQISFVDDGRIADLPRGDKSQISEDNAETDSSMFRVYCPRCDGRRQIKDLFVLIISPQVKAISGRCTVCETHVFKILDLHEQETLGRNSPFYITNVGVT